MKKILIVDDEPLLSRVFAQYLKNNGFEVSIALDGEAALKFLEKQIFNLVVIDLRMPGMGGRELLAEMYESYYHVPRIVITAYGTDDDIMVALRTGASDFIRKPIDLPSFKETIQRIIKKAS